MDASSRHDAYAAEYDQQMQAYACYLPEVLFGLCFDALQPGQRLLEAGIGSGLAGGLFARAGLEVHGFDFSPAMLEICRTKGFAADLKLHDMQQIPWPYADGVFDHLVCCGVFHFIPEFESIFLEVRRLLCDGGWFAFTSKAPQAKLVKEQKYYQHAVEGLDIFEHSLDYIEAVYAQAGFARQKVLRCLVGPDPFYIWVVEKQRREAADELQNT